MQDYLQKQIILDFHFRGEQDTLEEKFPELKETARELLGYDNYYNLASMAGNAPEADSEEFKLLLEIHNKLNA